MKDFQKAYLRLFPGLNVFVLFYLTFNLTENYTPLPTKIFWIRSCIKRMVKCDVILKAPPIA